MVPRGARKEGATPEPTRTENSGTSLSEGRERESSRRDRRTCGVKADADSRTDVSRLVAVADSLERFARSVFHTRFFFSSYSSTTHHRPSNNPSTLSTLDLQLTSRPHVIPCHHLPPFLPCHHRPSPRIRRLTVIPAGPIAHSCPYPRATRTCCLKGGIDG